MIESDHALDFIESLLRLRQLSGKKRLLSRQNLKIAAVVAVSHQQACTLHGIFYSLDLPTADVKPPLCVLPLGKCIVDLGTGLDKFLPECDRASSCLTSA